MPAIFIPDLICSLFSSLKLKVNLGGNEHYNLKLIFQQNLLFFSQMITCSVVCIRNAIGLVVVVVAVGAMMVAALALDLFFFNKAGVFF